MTTNPLETLVTALQAADHRPVLVVTGAGISLASGIPTFRGSDPGAVWSVDVTELGTFDYFQRDPVGSWRWYLSRFDKAMGARPNQAHFALARLERWRHAREGEFLLVTQNIDTLHEQAGVRELVKVHGSIDRVRCPVEGCEHGAPEGSLPRSAFDLEAFRSDPSLRTLPRCPACAAPMRQHVLWFDELYQGHDDYQFDRVVREAGRASLFLFVGTSFSVGITDILVQSARLRGTTAFVIDPVRPQLRGLTWLDAKAEELLPAVCDRLEAASRS